MDGIPVGIPTVFLGGSGVLDPGVASDRLDEAVRARKEEEEPPSSLT